MTDSSPGGPGGVMADPGRWELKYRIGVFQYHQLRNAIRGFMERDAFTPREAGAGYRVRSLYFDTHGYAAFEEKMAGTHERVKFRLRAYEATPGPDTRIRVELKKRQGQRVYKSSVFVPLAHGEAFLASRHWPGAGHPILEEFAYLAHARDLRPKILVEYFREGYRSRAGDDLRVTFDHRVRSSHARALFGSGRFARLHHPHEIVFEMKYRTDPPTWVEGLARTFRLKMIANSKFTQGIQVARHDLLHPDGFVVVR